MRDVQKAMEMRDCPAQSGTSVTLAACPLLTSYGGLVVSFYLAARPTQDDEISNLQGVRLHIDVGSVFLE